MKKIKDYLIHRLGGMTKEEYRRSIELYSITDKEYRYISEEENFIKCLISYVVPSSGLNAENRCRLVFKEIMARLDILTGKGKKYERKKQKKR